MPSNESDCWMGLCGVVYDLSVYTPVHPGGSLLVAVYCGENATDQYAAYHNTSLLADVEMYRVGQLTPVEEDGGQNMLKDPSIVAVAAPPKEERGGALDDIFSRSLRRQQQANLTP
jgi:cytochrome b involved in lipid metabolism